MRHLRPLLLSTFLAGVLATQVGPVFAQTAGCPPIQGDSGAAPVGAADVAVYADEAPPPLPDYDQPPIPADGDMWTPGYWSWNGYEYFWVPGTWVEPPQPGFLWTPGYWGFVGGVYAFHRGYWGEHVGFYGGVNYGFGYGGVGFEGGHWDNGRFFYNRAVTNIGQVNIVNVYNQQVTINERTRVSFNGGPNGVDAKPTAAELEAAKDKRLAPTSDQLRNARVAGRTESAFVSANKGKPRIAATAKPGEFKGDAVVPAKAAGGPLKPAGATPQPTKGQLEEKKPGEPTPEATKAKPEKKLEQPKAEPTKVEPTPGETKANPENKLDRPKTEPTQLETPKPEPTKAAPEMKIERPKPEPTKIAPERKIEQPRPEPMRSPPSAAPRGKPEAGCGRPGEPVCPK